MKIHKPTITGVTISDDTITAVAFIKVGGTAIQYLMADGSVSDGPEVKYNLSQFVNDGNGDINYPFITAADVQQSVQQLTQVSAEWVSGMTFYTTAAKYPVNNQYHSATPGNVILNNGDSLFDRFDLILVNAPVYPATLGIVGKITGTPSANPEQPLWNHATQYPIKYVLVKQNATAITDFTNSVIWNENLGGPTEWSFSTNKPTDIQVITGQSQDGINSIEYSTLSGFNTIRFTNYELIDMSTINLVTYYLKLKEPYPLNEYLTVFFRQGMNSSIATVIFKHGENGFNANNLSYQKITINAQSLNVNAAFDTLWLGFTASGHAGVYVDWVRIQSEQTLDTPIIDPTIPNLQQVLGAGNHAQSPDAFSFVDMNLANNGFIDLFIDNGLSHSGQVAIDSGGVQVEGVSVDLSGALKIVDGLLQLYQVDSSVLYNETLVQFALPIAQTTINFPAKVAGTYTLATLDDIAAGASNLQQVTDIGNITTNSIFVNGIGAGGLGMKVEIEVTGPTTAYGLNTDGVYADYTGLTRRFISLHANKDILDTIGSAQIVYGIGAYDSIIESEILTANRLLKFPDKSGTIALIEDMIASGNFVSPLTTKGDVHTFSTTDTRLSVGSNGQVLTADNTTATGLKWSAMTGATGLEAINEGNGIGWRLIGTNPVHYGAIGIGSKDLSTFDPWDSTVEGDYGTSAPYSFAVGTQLKISGGGYSYIIGANSSITSLSYNNVIIGGFSKIFSGYGNSSIGVYNEISTDANGFVFLAGMNNRASGTAPGGTIGTALDVRGRGQVAVGIANTIWSGGNTDANRPMFTVGIGTSSSPAGAWAALTRADGFIVDASGVVTAPNMSIAEITAESTGKVLITKEYANANFSSGIAPTGLEKITQFYTGWRLIGQPAANYGMIGTNAIDLSISSGASTTRGATGANSFAIGSNSIASGIGAFATGTSIASGNYSFSGGKGISTASQYGTFAWGDASTIASSDSAIAFYGLASGSGSRAFGGTASGNYSSSLGINTLARSWAEVVVGAASTDYTPTSTTLWSATDRIFTVGNGTQAVVRSDALIILKNGTITAPSLTIALITSAGAKSLITKEYADATYTGGGVVSVTGTAVDNTDPLNPIINSTGGTTYVHPNHTGHVSSSGDGATTLLVAAITGQIALTSGLLDTDELLISDGGIIKRMDVSVLRDYMQSSLSFTWRPISDTAVNGDITTSITSNWAYDHNVGTGNGKHVPALGSLGQYLKHDATWDTPPDTIYVHPTTAGNKHIPAGGALNNILRWSADGTVVWGIDNDTVYVHPTTAGNKHIPAGGVTGNILIWSADGTAVWGAASGGSEVDTLQTVTTRGATTSVAISITNTIASTSTITGALKVSGGVGIAGALYVGGTIYAPEIIGTSDIRLKENIQPLNNAQLDTKYYTGNFINDVNKQQRVFVLAQELEQSHPEFVRTDDSGMKSVAYTDLHSAEISYLKKENVELRKLIEVITSKLNMS